MKKAIFGEEKDLDPHTVVLVSLANGADLLRLVFDRRELMGRKDRIEKLVSGELTGKATKEAIEAMQAAVMVAVIMPAIITTVIN